MRCNVVGCGNIAEYKTQVTNDCSGITYAIVVCREHYLEGWSINSEDREKSIQRILSEAERIDNEETEKEG